GDGKNCQPANSFWKPKAVPCSGIRDCAVRRICGHSLFWTKPCGHGYDSAWHLLLYCHLHSVAKAKQSLEHRNRAFSCKRGLDGGMGYSIWLDRSPGVPGGMACVHVDASAFLVSRHKGERRVRERTRAYAACADRKPKNSRIYFYQHCNTAPLFFEPLFPE